MTDFTNMTTEELNDNMEILMRKFEEATDGRTMMILARTIESMEQVRDSKSW